MAPLLSVVVITYQHVNYIKQCLDNILNQQTDFEFEIILGEDESSDGTRDICIDYANKFPDKIKLFLRSRKDVVYINGKPSGRFNFIECLKAAGGKYIAFCEGDDYWIDPLKLQKQVNFLEANPDYTITACNTRVIDDEENILKELSKQNYSFSIHDIIKGNFLGNNSNTVVFARSVLTDKNINTLANGPVGDWILWMLALQNGKGYYMQDVMGVYRMHGRGLWSGAAQEQRIQLMMNVYDFIGNVMPEHKNTIEKARKNYIEEVNSKGNPPKKSILYKLYKKLFKRL